VILQLQPDQVSEYWWQIKYGAMHAMELEPPANDYLQALLIGLLGGTHQCWLIFDDDHNLSAMGITCIVQENLTGISRLHVDAFYSYNTLSEDAVEEATIYVKKFARDSGCKQIRALTSNPRAARLLTIAGFYTGKTEYLLSCG